MKQPLGNVRGILLSSIVGASLLFSGCGSGASSESDAQGDNPVGSTVSTLQADSLVGTLDCLVGEETGLASADLDVLSAVPVTPEAVLGALQGMNPDASTVQELVAIPMTLGDTLAALQNSVPADSDALAALTGLQENLSPETLGQTVDPMALLALPTEALPLSLEDASSLLTDPMSALVMVQNAAQNIAGDVIACTPQAEIVIDTVACLLDAGGEGLGLVPADLRTLGGAELTPEAVLAALQALNPEASTVQDLLAVPMTRGETLALLQSIVPADSDPFAVIEDLKAKLSADSLSQSADLATLLALPSTLNTNQPLADVQGLLGNPTDALALVEGLALQSTVDEAKQCLQPEATIASLGSMLGTAETGLPLDPAALLMFSGTDVTANDILAAAYSVEPLAATVDELLATPIDTKQFLTALNTVLPENVQTVVGGMTMALPVGQTVVLGDFLTLPSEVLPLDPMDTSLQDVLGTSTNLLAMMQMMAQYSDAQSAVKMVAGMATQQVMATVGKAGGMVLLGNLMSQMPSEETLTAVVPAELEGLVSTVLATEDPLSVVTTLLDTNLIGDVLEGLLGGNPLLEALTDLLGADLANELSTILDGLTTDPTATLETVQGLLEGTLNDPTATTQTVQDLFGIDAGL